MTVTIQLICKLLATLILLLLLHMSLFVLKRLPQNSTRSAPKPALSPKRVAETAPKVQATPKGEFLQSGPVDLVRKASTTSESDINELTNKSNGTGISSPSNSSSDFKDSFQMLPQGIENPEKRANIIEEIVATEVSYTNQLKVLVEEYLVPLQKMASDKSSSNVTDDKIRTIFSNVEIIYNLHKSLCDMMTKNDGADVALVFEKFGAYLKMYTQYVNAFDNSANALESLKKESKKFRTFLDAKTNNKGFMDVRSYLITPIQRIPRYILLLKELLKTTPANHPQRASLEKSFVKIQEIATFVNDSKKDLESLGRLMQLQAHILEDFGEIIEPSRKLLKEGKVIRKTRGKVIQNKTGILFLFNNLVLWTQESLKYKGSFPLQSLVEIDPVENSRDAPTRRSFNLGDKGGDDRAGLVLKYAEENEDKLLELQFESAQERDEWVSVLQEAWNNFNPPQVSRLRSDSLEMSLSYSYTDKMQ